MDDQIWIELNDENEYDKVWDKFENKFNFKPSIYEGRGINEPKDSLVFEVGNYYNQDEKTRIILEKDLNNKILNCFKILAFKDKFIYALNWQHNSYKLDIHNLNLEEYNKWIIENNSFLYEKINKNLYKCPYHAVPVFPNGDYYIFLTLDMTNGIFGHPWRRTICVFGKELIELLNKDKPQLFSKLLRNN